MTSALRSLKSVAPGQQFAILLGCETLSTRVSLRATLGKGVYLFIFAFHCSPWRLCKDAVESVFKPLQRSQSEVPIANGARQRVAAVDQGQADPETALDTPETKTISENS